MLPSDRYLAELLGLSEEQFLYFKAEVQRRAKEQPEPAVVAGLDPITQSIILLVIGIGFQVAASFLKPSIPQQQGGRPAQLKAANRGGQARTENERFTPRYGFDSTQDITTLGSTIPLVYALREAISGTTYGGVRVSTPMLWSQIYSLGGSQLLRAVFLIGEGPIASIDTRNFASGNSTLTSYDFGSASANEVGSRMTVYGRYASGLTTRITQSDKIYGRSASEDLGNAQKDGASDVFMVWRNGSWQPDFSAANRPSNQTTFGVYSLCGNDFGMRVNPVFKPQVQPQLIPYGDDGDAKVKCTVDDTAWSQRRKARAFFGSRSGITSSGLGSIGGTTSYTLYASSDKDTAFSRDIKSLTTVSDWVLQPIELRAKEGAGTFVKSINKGFAHYHDDTEDENTTVINDLKSRISASISGPITVDSTGKGSFDIAVSFNTTGLEDGDNDNEDLNLYLQTLKAVKFIIRFKNDLTADDPEDDITVRYKLQILVRTKVKQKFKADGGSVSEPTLEVTTNEAGLVTAVSISGGGGTIDGLTTEQTFTTPQFKFKRTDQMIASSGKVTAGTNVTGTFRLKFNAKKIYTEKCEDVASTVAGRQKTWDDSLIVGELYKIGSGLAICSSKSPGVFVSDSDITGGTGTSITASFKTVRVGAVSTNSAALIQKSGSTWLDEDSDTRKWRNVATTDGHVLRCAIASISTTRPCQAIELGIRSRLGIRINGLTNFREALGFAKCDDRACEDYKGDIIESGATLQTDIYQSNTLSAPVERYSFFAIYYREAGSTGGFAKLNNAYGVRGSTQQNIFNYIQISMPAVKQWEFQIEPYSGWEIRNGGVGTLYILEASLSTRQTVSEVGGVSVVFNGTSVPHSSDTFAIPFGRRSDSKDPSGYPRTDKVDFPNGDESYIDTWGKLAEAFIYEEAQSSASSGPEHEVVYVNEIVPNGDPPPLYDDLALVGINVMSSVEWQQFGQFSCYVTGGKTCRRLRNSLTVGATHLFPDVLLDLMTNATYGAGDLITDEMIDLAAFEAAADWCQIRRYFFDGVQADRVNLRQWAADTAAANLLIFGETDGKFYLRPALQFTAVSIKGLFTAGNIVEGSFKLQYLEPEEREPIQVSVRYREERASTDLTNPGIFPTEREVLVREASGSAIDPVESLDLSDYVTSREHAIDAAKYIIRMRRIPTHAISFRTTHEGALAKFGPSDYIRVAMDETQYDEFNNGVVTAAGALVSTKPLADGSYDVIAWDGTEGTPPADATLTVSGGGTQATPTGVVFTVKLPSTQVRTYQIERITPDEEGTFNIEAVHMPTNASGVLDLADGFDTAGNWVIE
jgi:hypothetical protein